jgi:hypothetical protein
MKVKNQNQIYECGKATLVVLAGSARAFIAAYPTKLLYY